MWFEVAVIALLLLAAQILFTHFEEQILKRRLYRVLRQKSTLVVSESVTIPQPKARPAIPVWVD